MKRTISLQIKLGKSEYEAMKDIAEKDFLNVSVWARSALLKAASYKSAPDDDENVEF